MKVTSTESASFVTHRLRLLLQEEEEEYNLVKHVLCIYLFPGSSGQPLYAAWGPTLDLRPCLENQPNIHVFIHLLLLSKSKILTLKSRSQVFPQRIMLQPLQPCRACQLRRSTGQVSKAFGNYRAQV